MEIFKNEFFALYSGKNLLPLKLGYKDYSQWQYRQKQRPGVKKQETYWLQQFAQQVPILNLPTDYPRPAARSFEGKNVNFEIDGEVTKALKELALNENMTLFMVLLSIYTILLAKLAGQEDIIVGAPIMGRRHADLQQVIGMFVNTLALRNYPAEEKTFKAFLREVKERTLEAFENQDYQFEELVDKAGLKRDPSRNPLFDVVFIMQNMEMQEKNIPGLKIKSYEYENNISKFDLTLACIDAGKKLFFTVEYASRLFKPEMIERFIRYFKEILRDVLEDTDIQLKDIKIIHDLLTGDSDILQHDKGDFGF
jgi:non-ribosomal peptide synthetase component F